jgi:hypothetical protein
MRGDLMETSDVFGSAPLIPIDRRRGFWGSLSGASGTPPRVVALAAQPNGTLIFANIVGYQTACSAHFARLWMGESLQFTPDRAEDWAGSTSIQRDTQMTYREHGGALRGVPLVNAIGMLRSCDITHGLKTLPVFPPQTPDLPLAAGALADDDDALTASGALTPTVQSGAPRFVLGNAAAHAPSRNAFDGHLRALRVVRYYDTRSMAIQHRTRIWTDHLWTHGLADGLITELPALGIRAWQLSGDLLAWADVISSGLRSGWLRRPDEQEDDHAHQ